MSFQASNPGHRFVITDKLDGVSALLQWKDNKFTLYTRGNGEVGQNITHLAPYLLGIPPIAGLPPTGSVRCELILSKVRERGKERKEAKKRRGRARSRNPRGEREERGKRRQISFPRILTTSLTSFSKLSRITLRGKAPTQETLYRDW